VLLIYLSSAWVAGILLGLILDLPLVLISAGLIPLLLQFIIRRYRKTLIIVGLCFIVFFGGATCYQSSLPTENDSDLRFYNDQSTVEIKGLVERDPEHRDRITHLRLSARELKLGGEWRNAAGTALLFVPRYPDYSYGDFLLVTGKLETPPRFDTFDYRDYLSRQEIYSTMLYPKIELIDTSRGFPPLEWVYQLRKGLSKTIAEVLPEPQASLTQGVVLGIKGNIPESVRADFTRTGTAHLLAISGLHLSIVAGIILSLGIWLFGRRGYIYVWLALGIIWLYASLTGMNAPVVRAAIMASIFLTAELLGRQRSAITALTFAAAVMVGIDPQVLWTASFQMSFMAMTGLIFVCPRIQTPLRRLVARLLGEEGAVVSMIYFVVDGLSVSLGAIIAVWPLVAYYFGIISPVAPLATLFALPALPAIIVTGALAGVIGLIALPVAQVIAWLNWLFSSYILLVVNIFTWIPSIEGASVNAAFVWLYYSVLALGIWLVGNKEKVTEILPKADSFISRLPGKLVITPLIIAAILVSITAAGMPDGRLHTSFLDVGQGDAILIKSGSQQILVDGGPGPQAIARELSPHFPYQTGLIGIFLW